MIELSVNNLAKYYGANKVFYNISFEIKTGEKVGFIGQNGCGKTTMMKIIMGMQDYQEGTISLRKGSKVGYLEQMPAYATDVKSIDVIHMAFEQTFQIKKQLKALEEQMVLLLGDELDQILKIYGKLTEQYEQLGGYELELRVDKITTGLQIPDSLKNMQFDQLSGGEKTRVMLAKILLEEPDILLLDEPTNHLDLSTIEWLEDFIKGYKGTVIIISHDRYFLDSSVNKIIELLNDQAAVYFGNYSYYVEEKERRFLIEYRNYMNQQKKIDQMERQIERYRIWGEMRDSEKMFKRAKELEKRLEKIDVLYKPIINKRKIKLNQKSALRTGKIVLEAEGLSKSYCEKLLFQGMNLNLYYQDSTCIIGKNGCGKTTLLRMVLGEINPDHGTLRLGSQVKIGYLPQNIVFEDEEQTILEYFTKFHRISNETARAQLARVLFMKEDVNKKIKYLSGGEKSRLRLCSLTFEGVNFMILDEPTNHLDIDSREVLEETLSEFEGTILMVSHDRYFINKIADKIVEIKDSDTKIYEGDYMYYLEECRKLQNKAEEIKQNIGKHENKSILDKNEITSTNTKNRVNHLTKKSPDMSEYQLIRQSDLENEIDHMEKLLKEMDKQMELHSTEPSKLGELFHQKEEIEKKLESTYELWESISVQIIN